MRTLAAAIIVLGLGFLAPRPAAAQCDDGCAELVDYTTGEVVGYGCMAGGERKNCVARRTSCIDEPCEMALLTDVNGVLLAVADRCAAATKPSAFASLPRSGKKALPGPGEAPAARISAPSSASPPRPERLGLVTAGR